MKTNIRLAVCSALLTWAAVLGVACASDSGTGESNGMFQGGQRAPSVSGNVSYNERLDLTPGANLIVELRDTSYADAESDVVASQTIANPWQVPIKFSVEYDPDRIEPRNRYSVSARIVESDGRLAFINDTAHEVLTRGNPDRVDMLLVLVEPPPDLVATLDSGRDWRTWRETPADVLWANLIPNEPVHLLRVAYFQSAKENCARPGQQKLTLEARDINVRLTLMQPPETPWAPACDEELVELDTILHVGASLTPGRRYRVIVNDVETTTFTVPDAHLGHTVVAQSPVQSAKVANTGSVSHPRTLRVVSGLPKGSGCSRFNGYEIRRQVPHQLDVVITHHEVVDPSVVCTADLPQILETDVPLGSEFNSGEEYTVNVNEDTSATFVAR